MTQQRLPDGGHIDEMEFEFRWTSENPEHDTECEGYDDESMEQCPCWSCANYIARRNYDRAYWDKFKATIARLEQVIKDNKFYRTGEYRKEAPT